MRPSDSNVFFGSGAASPTNNITSSPTSSTRVSNGATGVFMIHDDNDDNDDDGGDDDGGDNSESPTCDMEIILAARWEI